MQTSYSLPANAPVPVVDWRDSPELPRRCDLPASQYINGCYYRKRNQPITLIAVHHAASEADVKEINTFHETTGYFDGDNAPHIAYHFAIENDGTIIQCNYVEERSWHATRANDSALGICLQGDLDKHAPSDKQRIALQWLLDTLCEDLKIPRTGVWGHGELMQYGNSTSCPGSHLLPLVKAYRAGQQMAAIGVYEPTYRTLFESEQKKYITTLGVAQAHEGAMKYAITLLTRGSDDGDSAEKMRIACKVLQLALAGQWATDKDGKLIAPEKVQP